MCYSLHDVCSGMKLLVFIIFSWVGFDIEKAITLFITQIF
jgi:hypothetical protein